MLNVKKSVGRFDFLG